MRKSTLLTALLIAVSIAASGPALAKAKKAKPAPQPAVSQNEGSWRLVRDAFPLLLPSVAQAAYLSTQQDAKKKDAKK